MTLSRIPRALGVSTAAAILSACGASQPPTAGPGATAQAKAVRVAANRMQDIYDFKGSPDGAQPMSAVGFNRDNPNVPSDFSVTSMGGDSNNDGTVVGLTPAAKGQWAERVLYTFKGGTYGDGSEPLAADKDPYKDPESIFVSTAAGGTSNNGALVELSATSSDSLTESFIYSFRGTPDGANPSGGVVADKEGNLYGITENGGTNNAGTVYRMQPKGSSFAESVLYSFGGGSSDGAHPLGTMAIDKKGALYGTTKLGGSAGYGAVFKLTPSGGGFKESILHSFQGYSDGVEPEAGIAHTATDSIYGTTTAGGENNAGTVYELAPSGGGYKETVLWSFGSIAGDGADPTGSVCVTKAGAIYGTTLGGGSGGSSGLGTFFILTPSGSTFKETVYSFTGANGAYPFAGPSIGLNGSVLLTTESGGANNRGALVKGTTFKGSATCSF